jgi:RNA polymerase sigma-70 factor, ECF subfamily
MMAFPADRGDREDSGVRKFPSAIARLERPAWTDLVSLVRCQVRSIVGPTSELEDLTQATLEQVVRSLDRFEGRCELSTFTYRIASRVVMNHWRSVRRYLRRFVLGVDEVPEPEAASAETDPLVFVERQRAARLHHHLERMSADHRMVVVLADLDAMTAPRIAEILEIPEPTVRSRLRRARNDLAKRLMRDPLFAEEES